MRLKSLTYSFFRKGNRRLSSALLATIVLAIALPLLNIYVVYPSFIRIISSAIEEDAQRIAKHILPPSLKNSMLTHASLTDKFFADIYKLETDFGLMKVKVFSHKGEVLYSTEVTDLGHLNTQPYFHEKVAKGIPFTKLVVKDSKSLEGNQISIDVVETYVPFMKNDTFLGAFELYYDITKRKAKLEKLVTYSTIGMGLLSLGLLFVIAILLKKEAARIEAQEKAKQLKEDVDHITKHDLKSPLTGILGGISFLEDYTNLDDEQASIAEDMREAANKGMDMINRSLDLYKMETGTYQYTPQEVDIVSVSNRVVADLDDLARTKKIKVVIATSAPEDSTIIPGDETLLYSLTANLVKNAIEASNTGETVTLNLNLGQAIEMTVHNTTIVPEEIRDSFFDKYATAGKSTGTGLGTYSAKLMANVMLGNIAMTTSEEDGTRVTVSLPRTETHNA